MGSEMCIRDRNRGNTEFKINPYDRIAQLLFITVDQPKFELVQDFDETERGEGGFGSSGRT